MGLAQKSIAYIEPDEYLTLENASKEKHEYLDGVIYAWQGNAIQSMAGAPAEHNQVCINVIVALRALVKGRECQVYASDMRVCPYATSAYFYPDVMVRCGPKLPGDAMEVSDAALVVEVLSATTEGFDRQDKFERYRRMTSLQSYVLISPGRRTIEVFRGDQNWLAPAADRCHGDEQFELGMHGWSLLASEVFEGV